MKSLVAALALITATPVFAAPNCAPNDQVLDILVGKSGEEVISFGLDADRRVVTTWGNTETGSWTITIPAGETTCVVAQGGLFQRVVLDPNV